MTIDNIIKAYNSCFRVDGLSCKDCPLFETEEKERTCQKILSDETIEKLTSMRDLLDDKVNHHYYDMLEFYQEENVSLRTALDEIRVFVDEHTDLRGNK